ncbi:TldD/PmbA family protein [Dysgonomonas sp. 25]|uniref:TldD/PmbA family protein n=1 Tax=Dysgonomonas sp. 25 TaxID=2302933 RepID=UPI0013D51CD0|nr:TldD/PmbA family protein [Dysgonomonas sp. 25]NDV68269.1 TldD/PmbA family protein [Dysgonomonas sp. 25]
MITTEQKNIAQWAMNLALQNGCQASRVSIISGVNTSFEYRNTQLDKSYQSAENKLYIDVFIDGRYSSFSSNRIDKADLERFIKAGIESTKLLAPDPCKQLPDPSRYYKHDGGDLELYDASFDSITPEEKLLVTRQAVEEIFGSDERIISITSSYSDGAGAEYMITSNGFEAESIDSAFDVTVEVALKTGGDARAESYWFDSSIFWKDLKKTGIGQVALKRALQKIGQRKIQSGTYNMLLDNTVSARMVAYLTNAMFGSALQQKNSFLLDKLGQRIVSDKLTLTDNPHLPKSFGARWFDGEGVATKDRTIIEDGVLNMYFIDTYNSLKMNMQPTIASPSIVNMKLGNQTFDEIRQSLNKGIWVTGFNGGNCNATTGDFSFGIEGFLIEHGEISTPISEMNITGNMLTLWNQLAEIGNDPRLSSSRRIPTLLFEGVNFSGL